MKPIFADTSYLVALVGPNDALHARAVELSELYPVRLVTTEHVLAEAGGLLSRPEDRVAFVNMVRDLRSEPGVDIVSGDSKLFDAGFNLFARRSDKHWSLVDCISFAVMKERRLIAALTADHHFTQAGYRALMRERD